MKAWRAQFRAWPEERPRVMDDRLGPAWFRSAEARKQSARENLGPAMAFIAAFGIAAVYIFGLLTRLTPDDKGGLAVVVSLIVVALGLFGSGALALVWAQHRLETRRRRRDLDRLEAKGIATLRGDHVGISYAGNLWRHPVFGEDMDRGVLKIDFDRLVFEGLETRFELPASSIVRTEIRRYRHASVGFGLRLYITWRAEKGEESFSVSLPYAPTLRQRVSDVVDLRERVESWRTERRPQSGERSFSAPPTFSELGVLPSSVQPVGKVAFLLASIPAGIVAGLFALVLPAFMTIGVTLVTWPIFAQIIEKRLPERYRHADPDPAEIPSLSLGEAKASESEKPQIRA